MSIIDQIIGRESLREDEPPVQAARPKAASMARREAPQDKEDKKLRNKARAASVVAHIIGMAESEHEGIIPPDAKPVDPFNMGSIPGMKENPDLDQKSPSEPSLSNAHGEELIAPTAALVAPDVTPKVFQLIDPSQVPAPPKPSGAAPGPATASPATNPAQGALDTIMGRQTPSPGMPPVTAESFMQTISPLEIKSKAAEKLVPALAGGSAMPEHREGDGRTVFGVARRFIG